MILKDYQKQAIKNLEDFLQLLDAKKTIGKSFAEFWASRDVQARPPYQNNIAGVPQVCFKVPTGGGKTLMAAASLKTIFLSLPSTQTKIVVWLVPSETILSQTYKNLNDTAHPYRQLLDIDFSGQVAIYNKAQLLMGENFSPAEISEQLSILVLSYDSFRTSNKEGRKAFQQNGQLNKFFSQLKSDEEILKNADELSLIQVIRHYKPIVIVDESHHATTDLSLEMLKNFNPSFILELTATPKETSNIIAYVPAWKLKAAGMVKLPVIVYNRRSQEDVISDAINFRDRLEKISVAEKIRPIILFQAESQGSEDRATFDKIKSALIENFKIPAEQIAIKTANINDLKNIDLSSADCPIRFIITINALKEGWDCPFAYILASLANRTSTIDVEQILGRILRRPFTKNFSDELLNMSYVFTSSADFRQTLSKIVVGLNSAGFTEKEFRAVDENKYFFETELAEKIFSVQPENLFADSTAQTLPTNIPSEQNANINSTSNNFADEMEQQARTAEKNYNDQNFADDENSRSDEEKKNMNDLKMRDKFIDAREILLPQFFTREDTGDLFNTVQEIKIEREMFSTKFSLKDQDTVINFDNLNYEIVSFDVYDDEDLPRLKFFSETEVKNFLEYFDKLTTEGQVNQCAAKITKIIDRHNTPQTQDIFAYVKRIVSTFDSDRLHEAVQYSGVYANKIKTKIQSLLTEHAKKKFLEQIDARKIFAKPSYQLSEIIHPTTFQKIWVNSLYEGEEGNLTDLEFRVAGALTSLENVLWWHRNRVKKEFCINGFINHFPDFIVKMKSGIILLVEAKGDDRDNSNSKNKLELGKIWESKAGSDKFGYLMVFENNPISGALTLDEFLARIKML